MAPDIADDAQFTVSEAETLTGVSRWTFARYAEEKLIPRPVKRGPNTRYSGATLKVVIRARQLVKGFYSWEAIRQTLTKERAEKEAAREVEGNKALAPAPQAAPAVHSAPLSGEAWTVVSLRPGLALVIAAGASEETRARAQRLRDL